MEGTNLAIEYCWAEGHYDRLPAMARELVGLPVDLLMTRGTPGTWAAKRETSSPTSRGPAKASPDPPTYADGDRPELREAKQRLASTQ